MVSHKFDKAFRIGQKDVTPFAVGSVKRRPKVAYPSLLAIYAFVPTR